MKKFLAILLVMMLALVSVSALASAPDEDAAPDIAKELGNPAPSPAVEFELTKTYTVEGVTGVNPADVLEFTVEGVGIAESSYATTDIDKFPVTIEAVEVPMRSDEATIVVRLPEYDLPGVYSYTITEDDTGIAGVTYLGDTLYLNVTIASNDEKNALYVAGIAVHQAEEDGTKIDEFENIYTAGSLTVSKEVTGNMGDFTKDFTFEVEFTIPDGYKLGAPITITYPDDQDDLTTEPVQIDAGEEGTVTATFTLKHGQEVTFNNIPAEVSYTVTESDYDGYDVTPTGETGEISDAAETAAFVNDKTIVPDTGVALESLPYVLMAAITLAGFVALKLRKREEY